MFSQLSELKLDVLEVVLEGVVAGSILLMD